MSPEEAYNAFSLPEGVPLVASDEPKHARLNPPQNHPIRQGMRYTVSPRMLGRLERLAKTRFDIGQIMGSDVDAWTENEDTKEVLAQSVNASSAIEGEGITAHELTWALAVVTEPLDESNISQELVNRRESIRSIYNTAVWALTEDRHYFITYDFVLELHYRMFATSKKEIAGKLKNEEIIIQGRGYFVQTLTHTKAQEYLRVLCERTEDALKNARDNASNSMLLIVAEFIVDFLAIHPFKDGNGRTSRLLSTYLLEKCGYNFTRFYPVDSYILETRSEYYQALYLAQKKWYLEDEDLTIWMEYYIKVIFNQWQRACQRVLEQKEQQI
jgi:Fic family protein